MTTRHRHRWHSDTRIGCSENPGCQDRGDGSLIYYLVCECGASCRQIRYYARGRGPDRTMVFSPTGKLVYERRE